MGAEYIPNLVGGLSLGFGGEIERQVRAAPILMKTCTSAFTSTVPHVYPEYPPIMQLVHG